MISGSALFEKLVQTSYNNAVTELNAAQQSLVTQYQSLLAEKDGFKKALDPFFPYFDVHYSADTTRDFPTVLHAINCLRQRVHISHFFLTHVFQNVESEALVKKLLHLFMGDLAQLSATLSSLYGKNQVPLGECNAIVEWLHFYDLMYQFWLPHYKPSLPKETWVFYQTLALNMLHHIQPLIVHGNYTEARKRIEMANEHAENAKKHIMALAIPLKQKRAIKAELTDKIAKVEHGIPRTVDHMTEHGSTVSMYQTLLIFEKQLTNDLAIFCDNIKVEKPMDAQRVTELSQQIKSATDEIAGAEKSTLFWIMLNIKLKSILTLLQVDQLQTKDEAKVILPLMRKLLQAWHVLFKNPSPLMKMNLEILEKVSSLLGKQILTINGITPKEPTLQTAPFYLAVPRAQLEAVAMVVPQKPGKRSAARKRAAERKKANQSKVSETINDEPSSEPESSNDTESPAQIESLIQTLGNLALNDLQPVKDKKITLTPAVIAILDKLEAAGFKAYVKGGYVRDSLLGCIPNDIDLVTHCPSDQISQVLGTQFTRNYLIQDKVVFQDNGIELVCSSNTLLEEANSCDITINALFADKSGNIYDPLNIIADLDKSFLETVGDPEISLQDPKRLLRLPRIGIHVGKTIPISTIESMQKLMPTVHQLAFGVYLSNITKLFCHGKGALAWDFFDRHQLIDPLLNRVPKIEKLTAIPDPAIRYYMHSKLMQLDNIYLHTRVPVNPYHVLAILLVPELIANCQSLPGTMVNDMIDALLESFCRRECVMCEAELTCFKRSTHTMLVHFYSEFLTTKAHMTRPAIPKTPLKLSLPFVPAEQGPLPLVVNAKQVTPFTPSFKETRARNRRPIREASSFTLADFIKAPKPTGASAKK